MATSPELVTFIEKEYLRGFLDAQLLPAIVGTSSTKESDQLASLFLQHTTKTMYAICALNNLDFGQQAIVLARTIFEYSIRLAYIYRGNTDSEIKARARSFFGRAYEDQLQKQNQVDELKKVGKCLTLIRDIEVTGSAPTSSSLQKDWDDFPNEKRMATELGEPFECDWYFLYWSMSKIAHPTTTNLLKPDVDGDSEWALLLAFNYHYRIAEIVCSALGDAGSALRKKLDERASKFLTLCAASRTGSSSANFGSSHTLGSTPQVMKLNGWMRLWIVLSTVWLLAIGIQAYTDLSSVLERKEWDVSKEGIGHATFVFSKSESEDLVRHHINEELIPLVAKNPSVYVGKITTSHYDALVKKELVPRITQYLKEAFLPIVFIFFLGGAFVWIKRGFVQPWMRY